MADQLDNPPRWFQFRQHLKSLNENLDKLTDGEIAFRYHQWIIDRTKNETTYDRALVKYPVLNETVGIDHPALDTLRACVMELLRYTTGLEQRIIDLGG